RSVRVPGRARAAGAPGAPGAALAPGRMARRGLHGRRPRPRLGLPQGSGPPIVPSPLSRTYNPVPEALTDGLNPRTVLSRSEQERDGSVERGGPPDARAHAERPARPHPDPRA